MVMVRTHYSINHLIVNNRYGNDMANNTSILDTERVKHIINQVIERATTLNLDEIMEDDSNVPDEAEMNAIADAMSSEERRDFLMKILEKRIELMKDWDDE